MRVDERLSAAVSDYRIKHGGDPRRITVSTEVARELEAVLDARDGFIPDNPRMTRLREGRQLLFQGILVVADLDDEDIVDIR